MPSGLGGKGGGRFKRKESVLLAVKVIGSTAVETGRSSHTVHPDSDF